MEIREIVADELDYTAMLCVDPGISRKQREEMKAAMDVRKKWLKAMMDKGLQVSVALEKSEVIMRSFRGKKAMLREMIAHGNVPMGLVEYLPIEFASEPVKGGKSLFINCIWVWPPFWHSGVAKSLLERAIEKAKSYGGLSVLAYEGDKWFGFFPYMPASFFRSFGFKEVDRDGSRVVLYLKLGSAEAPQLIRSKCKAVKKSGRVVVDVFSSSQCPWSGLMVDKIKQNIGKYDAVVNIINTDDRENIEKYGMSRGVCINGVPVVKRVASWREIEKLVKQAKQD